MSAAKFRERNGGKGFLIPGKSDFGLKDFFGGHLNTHHRLNESTHPARNARFDAQNLARHSGAKDFRAANGGEFQIAKGFTIRIALGDDACELGACFDKQDAGHERLIWKMSAQKRFIAAQFVFGDSVFARHEIKEAVYEAEFMTMREVIERVHFLNGSMTV
jgi:hypothetical protein